ncbi:Rrf2 family transcriptional regulator [Rhizobium sp. Rhizsp82]|uniref:Rrf2 family transcriptional regulator n=1 Tax=Rhizobium sp. Rhizsp82 TaxID=3243057 RepID=UPI0039B607B0
MGNTRFPTALQIVVTVATNEAAGIRTTSPSLADGLNTNASFVRKIVATLCKAALLSTSGGVSGGIRLARSAQSICLLDIHGAVLPDSTAWTARHCLPGMDRVSRNIETIADDLAARADKAIAAELIKTTVQDCIDEIANLEGKRAVKTED